MKTITSILIMQFIFCITAFGQQIEVADNTTGEPAIKTSGSAINNAIEINNNSEYWRLTTWTNNNFLIVNSLGEEYAPFSIVNNAFHKAVHIASDGVGVGKLNPTARLHVKSPYSNVLNLEAPADPAMSFYTGDDLQYQFKKLGSSASNDFQFINPSLSGNTTWLQGGTEMMSLNSLGYLLLKNGNGTADARLHVAGNADTDMYEVKISDENHAFMKFESDVESGISFGTESLIGSNIWNKTGTTEDGLVFNASDLRDTVHLFIEKNTGRVGIGEDKPGALLDVSALNNAVNIGVLTGDPGFLNVQMPEGSTNSFVQRWADDDETVATMNDADATYQLSVLGNVVSSLFWVLSDQNLKENIQPLEAGTLSKVMKLNPTKYTFKKNEEYKHLRLPSENQIGFLAQELGAEFPEAVKQSTESNGDSGEMKEIEIMTVNYMALVPVLTKAIQEQQNLIMDQKAMIDALEVRVSNLEK